MIIKICGLQTPEHALTAAEAGADLLGFVFAESSRRVTPEEAAGIISGLPDRVSCVGVFVNEKIEVINDIVSYCGLDYAQLHGNETPEECNRVSCPVIKAFRVRDEKSLEELRPYRNAVEMFLLDTYVPGVNGGTGRTFDWTLAARASELGRIILAGGLTPENVTQAILAAGPYGVDVSSGVETDGIKDSKKITAFLRQARGSENVHITG